jgi:hypothetical protein
MAENTEPDTALVAMNMHIRLCVEGLIVAEHP